MLWRALASVSLLLAPTVSAASDDLTHAKIVIDLKEALLEDYSTAVVPKLGVYSTTSTGPLEVNVGVEFYSLLSINDVESLMTLKIFLVMEWQDIYLVWDNATTLLNATDSRIVNAQDEAFINIDPSDVWLPDFRFGNAVEQDDASNSLGQDAKLTVTKQGRVRYSKPLTLTLSCPLELERFPFDDQKCQVQIVPASVDGNVQALVGSLELTKTFAYVNNEWTLAHLQMYSEPGEHRPETDPANCRNSTNCPWDNYQWPATGPWPEVVFELHLVREGLAYYMVYAFLPVTFSTAVSFLCFLLNPRVGERMGLSSASLLTIVAIMFSTAERLPVQKAATTLDVFYFASILMNMLVVFECAFVSWLSDITRGSGSKSFKMMKYRLGFVVDQIFILAFPVAYFVILFQTYSVALGASWTDTSNADDAKAYHSSGTSIS